MLWWKKPSVGLLLQASLITASSILLHGGTIIAFNQSTNDIEVIRDGSLLVINDRIADVYQGSSGTVQAPEDVEVVDVTNQIVTPGFIDTHHHLWQSVLKTIDSNNSLASYFAFFGENGPVEYQFTAEDSYISQLGGALESLSAGVTTIVDHAHGLWSNATADAVLQADLDSGARIFFGYAVHNLTNNWTISEQMAKFDAMASLGNYKNTTVSLGIAFDYFNSAQPGEIQQLLELTRRTNASFITSHYVGGPFLTDNSPEILNRYGVLNSSIPVILSHASYITEEGRQLLRLNNQYIAITPESELQLLFDTHNATKLIQDQAALGVDTNNAFSADIITQARIWLQRIRGLSAEPVAAKGFWPATNPMSVNQAFKLATRHGGLALRRDDLGIISRGAKADIVVVDTSSPPFLGWRDPVAAVILHAGANDVQHVIVDGIFRKRDGQLTFSNISDFQSRFLASADRLQSGWTQLPQLNVVGTYAYNESEYRAVEQVDIRRGPGTGYGTLQQ